MNKAQDNFGKSKDKLSGWLDEVGYQMELSKRTYEIFANSEMEDQRELLKFLLPNSKMDGENLVPSIQMPFDVIINCRKTKDWLPLPRLTIVSEATHFDRIIQAFQDLRYIGEMRQRWEEIKKLHCASSLQCINQF